MTFAEQCAEMHALEREALERGISGREYEDILREVTAEAYVKSVMPGSGPVEILAEVRRRVDASTAAPAGSADQAWMERVAAEVARDGDFSPA